VKETRLAGVAGRQKRHVPPAVHVLADIRARWLDEHDVCAMRRTVVCGISPFPSTRTEIG
jgi:hypothetical protein